MGRFTDWLAERKIDNPYSQVIARHLDTAEASRDRGGRILHGSVGEIPAFVKDGLVDVGLGTFLGVPGELGGLLGQQATDALALAAAGHPEYRPGAGTRGEEIARLRGDATGGNRVALGVGDFVLDPTLYLGVGLPGAGRTAAQRSVQRASKLDIPQLAARAKQAAQAATKATTTTAATKAAGASATGPSVANVAEALAGKVDEAAKVAPDLSLGNLNERFNASPVALADEATPPKVSRNLSLLLDNAYGDKRRFAVPALLKRLGARVEPDGRFTRDGADITDKVYAFLENRPGLKPKEADKALAALADEVTKPLAAADEGVILYHGSPRTFASGDIRPGRPGMYGSAISLTTDKGRALGYARELGTEGVVHGYTPSIANPIEINDLPPQFKGVGGTKFDELFRALRDPQGNPYDAVVDEAAGNVFVYDRGKLTPIVEAGEALPDIARGGAGGARDLPPGALRGAPPAGDNFRKPLAEYTNSLFHESDLDNALEWIDPATMGGPRELYFSNTPDLATGQGKNVGVLLEIDPRGIAGQVNRSKPTWVPSWGAGQAEFIARDVSPGAMRDNVRSITVTPKAVSTPGMRTRAKRILDRLVAEGWQREALADGSARYTRPLARGGDIAAGGGGMGIVSPTGRMLLRNPEVLTTAIGATGGALVGGLTDPDGGADGMLGGALAGAGLGYGAGKLPAKTIKQTLGVMHQEGKKAWVEAWQHGGFSIKSLGRAWRDDKTKTVRGLAIDELSNRVRALINGIPQASINGTFRSLLDRRRAAGALVPYDDELEEMLKLSYGEGFDPAKFNWSSLVGQGYMAGAGDEGAKALHPLADALAGAGFSLAGAGAAVPLGAVPLGAARGFARAYTTGGFQAANDLGHYAVRVTAYKREARALLQEAHTVFAAQLRAVGADPALLSRSDGLYSAEEVAAKYGDEAGKAWKAIQDQIYGVPAIKAVPEKAAVAAKGKKLARAAAPAVEAAEQADGLAGRFVKDAFGDYSNPSFAHKALDTIAPFSRYAVGQMKPLAQMAARHPGAALALAHWIQQDRARAKQEGRPGYQVGTVRADTETPLVGRLVRAQLGGAEGEGRVNPTQAALVVSGGQVGATDQFEDADTPYKWAEAVLETMGFQFNPAIQAAAYVVGGDFGTDRAPGAQSRTARIEQALPGPQVPGLRGVLDRATEAMGNEADTYDPVELLAKEIIFERTGKPAVDPANAAVAKQLADPNSPLMQEARERYQAGGVVGNTVSLISPITAQASTDEKVAYRRAKVEQAGQETKTGAAAIYKNPKGLNTYRNGKKVDPRLADWERRNSTLRRVAPKAYARQRAAFIEAAGIKE